MKLFPSLQRGLAEQNYRHPTPIQQQTIPPAIEGSDILGCAQTGTGKTAAFALPILDFLGHESPPTQRNRPTVLVLAPTRELAIQIGDSFLAYGKHMKFRLSLVYGGVGQGRQVSELRNGVDVLVATPGRLQDLMDQGHVNLCEIEIFVLDEADRMLDMGFLPALKKIIANLPDQKQSLFFSATLPTKIRKLAGSLLVDPVSVTIASNNPTVERIDQSILYANKGKKLNPLVEILSGGSVQRAIVFTRTKHGASGLAKKLVRRGIPATAIHGNKSQNARKRALDSFRSLDVSVLVATDVAARGIDVDGITHVINYDMPVDAESYVHRIGRTARAGATGIAVSFCTEEELDELRGIEKLIRQKIRVQNPAVKFNHPKRTKEATRSPRKAIQSKQRKKKVEELRRGAKSNFRRRKKTQMSGKGRNS